MLPLSVFTLALLGGYIFVTRWHWTGYHALRSSGYHLVFASAIAGAVFLFLATTISSLALTTSIGKTVSGWWHHLVPPEHSGTAAIAFLLGALLWCPLNKLGKHVHWLSDEAAIDREVAKKRNPLEVLLHQAMKSQSVVSVSIKNGKVYIGRITSTVNPALGMQAINLVLRRSGHRDNDTQEMRLDVNYDKTHAKIKQDIRQKVIEQLIITMKEKPDATEREWIDFVNRKIGEDPDVRNYEIAIPIAEVQSANVFDMSIYDEYFASKEDVRAFITPP